MIGDRRADGFDEGGFVDVRGRIEEPELAIPRAGRRGLARPIHPPGHGSRFVRANAPPPASTADRRRSVESSSHEGCQPACEQRRRPADVVMHADAVNLMDIVARRHRSLDRAQRAGIQARGPQQGSERRTVLSDSRTSGTAGRTPARCDPSTAAARRRQRHHRLRSTPDGSPYASRMTRRPASIS